MSALGLGADGLGDGFQIHRLRRERLGLREEKEVARDAAHLLGLAPDRADVLGGLVGLGGVHAQGQVRVAVDRGRGVAELVRRSGGDFAEIREVPHQRDPALEPSDLGQIREEGHGAEEPAVAALGGRRGHAEDPLLLAGAAPPRLAPPGDGPVLEHVGDESAKLGRLGEQTLVVLAAAVARELEDLPARLVDLDDGAARIHREQPRREVARERAGGRLEVVGAVLLALGEALELALLLVQGLDRGLESRQQELPLVALLAPSAASPPRERRRPPRAAARRVSGASGDRSPRGRRATTPASGTKIESRRA